jgi:hypothetical protein
MTYSTCLAMPDDPHDPIHAVNTWLRPGEPLEIGRGRFVPVIQPPDGDPIPLMPESSAEEARSVSVQLIRMTTAAAMSSTRPYEPVAYGGGFLASYMDADGVVRRVPDTGVVPVPIARQLTIDYLMDSPTIPPEAAVEVLDDGLPADIGACTIRYFIEAPARLPIGEDRRTTETMQARCRAFFAIKPGEDQIAVASFASRHAQALIDRHVKAGTKPEYLRKMLRSVRRLFAILTKRGGLKENPCADLKLEKASAAQAMRAYRTRRRNGEAAASTRGRALTREEMALVLKTARPDLGAILSAGVVSLCRPGEILCFNRGNYLANSGRYRVAERLRRGRELAEGTKSADGEDAGDELTFRETLMPPLIAAMLDHHFGTDAEGYWLRAPRGKLWWESNFRRYYLNPLNVKLTTAGMSEGVALNDLRHTGISALRNAGVDRAIVAHYAGHWIEYNERRGKSDERHDVTTRVYTHPDSAWDQRCTAILLGFLGFAPRVVLDVKPIDADGCDR